MKNGRIKKKIKKLCEKLSRQGEQELAEEIMAPLATNEELTEEEMAGLFLEVLISTAAALTISDMKK